jgi:sugar O-acyltransferase (sialic acid O-acetyltransferase NeuD family)
VTDGLAPLVIIGAGGFGREVLELVRDINSVAPTFEFLGFLDDGPANVELLERMGAKVLGPSTLLAQLDAEFVIAIGAAEPRRRIDAMARSLGRTAATLTHPSATIGSDVVLGEGAVVAAGARLTTGIAVGRHAQVNLNCTIGHDATIEDYATLFAGVHLGGGCVIEQGATLGTGCVIVPNVRVGRSAVVGAGAVVVRDVVPGSTVVSTAARPTLGSRPSVAKDGRPPAAREVMQVRQLDAGAPEWGEFLGETPHDFYHLPAYAALCAEQEQGEARAVLVEDGRRGLLLPLILRSIVGTDRRDAASPYGYPGPLLRGTDDPGFMSAALTAAFASLRSEGIVSAFVRLHPLLNSAPPIGIGEVVLHGDTVSIDLDRPWDEYVRDLRHNHRRDIKKAVQRGLVAREDLRFSAFPEFERLYRATMDRRSAAAFYYFDSAYFEGLRKALGDSLHLLVVETEGEIVAAGLFVETAGIVQYHLGGSADAFAKAEAAKLIVHFAASWAKERGNHTLHLGGGVGGANDSLLYFKTGFSPLRHPFRTWRVIVDAAEYASLVRTHDPGADPSSCQGFFPAYRCL